MHLHIRCSIVSTSPHLSNLESGLILDLNASLFVHTVMLKTWTAVSLIFEVREGSHCAWMALWKGCCVGHMFMLFRVLVWKAETFPISVFRMSLQRSLYRPFLFVSIFINVSNKKNQRFLLSCCRDFATGPFFNYHHETKGRTVMLKVRYYYFLTNMFPCSRPSHHPCPNPCTCLQNREKYWISGVAVTTEFHLLVSLTPLRFD
jgi:hypothetical protein